MRRYQGRLRLFVVLLAALLVASVGSVALRPTAASVPALSVRVDRPAIKIQVGARAIFAATITRHGSGTGPVSLSVKGAPRGARVQIVKNPMGVGSPYVVSVLTNASTKVGRYQLKVTAKSGTNHTTATVRLRVMRSTGLRLTLYPPARFVVAGASTTYRLSIQRGYHLARHHAPLSTRIVLRTSGLPKLATAALSPSRVALHQPATLTVRTTANTRPGAYRIVVFGRSGRVLAWASAYLVVRAAPSTRNFPISGDADRVLAPGAPSGAIDLALTNPNTGALSVSALGTTVTGTNKAGCGVTNYAVTGYAGPLPLTIPARTTRTLMQLGVPRAQWPQVTMLNLPVNQDVCQGATVQLPYSGVGSVS